MPEAEDKLKCIPALSLNTFLSQQAQTHKKNKAEYSYL
ncbi:hypothetical protein SEEGA711_04434 [Salmonella enterica subsp. enterica serovar Gaminara str. ATCC BAA-711]|nr:hypothetical protein SEEGA711_04434 [Salmonella enterica subsp. enterica serovar Gaminara str. ATCC BAA-711]